MGIDKAERQRRKSKGAFSSLSHAVHDVAIIKLSYSARAILLEFIRQYNGRNNGSLIATYKYLRPRGIKSQHTIADALKELCDVGLIVQTRIGKRPNTAALFALTWYGYDYDANKHELPNSMFPVGAWRPEKKP